jgi:glycosyltransferase involved in cell wall biosynthesis
MKLYMSTKFTIILPNYKTEYFLEECLNSLHNQTFKDFEVLLVNDGSVGLSEIEIKKFYSEAVFNNTLDISGVEAKKQCDYIFNNLVKQDPRFKLINKANGGQSSARNLALNWAQGEYIVFLDCDDYLDKDYLLEANKRLEVKNKDEIIYGSVKLFEDGIISDYIKLNKQLPVINNLANMLVFPSWTPTPINYFWPLSIIKKYELQYPEGKKGEDTNFILENILSNYKEFKNKEILKAFVPVPNSIYFYRQFKEQMTKQSDFEFKLFNDMTEHMESKIGFLETIDWKYGLLGKLFVKRFRLYNKRNMEKNKFMKIGYSIYAKTLTLVAIFTSKTV